MCDFSVDIAWVADRHNVDPKDLSHMFPRLAPLLRMALSNNKGKRSASRQVRPKTRLEPIVALFSDKTL
jgi:hypothetical protein